MKLVLRILTISIIVGAVTFGGSVAWRLYDFKARINPEIYKPWLDTGISVYADVDTVPESKFQSHAYDVTSNRYVNAIPNSWRTPNIASVNGEVPAFKMGDDIFIITFKWVNRSSGLAISDSPDFIERLESLDDYVDVKHLSENVYAWRLHLNYTRQEIKAR